MQDIDNMEEKRELIYRLCEILGYMEVFKDGKSKLFQWSKELNKPIRIK